LGRCGLAEIVERNCRQARMFSDGLIEAGAGAGIEVLNEVVLNQVVAAFGDEERSLASILATHRDT